MCYHPHTYVSQETENSTSVWIMLECVSSTFSWSGVLQPGIKSNILEVSAIFKSYVLSLLQSTACSSLSPRITRLQEKGEIKHMVYWNDNEYLHYKQFQNPRGWWNLKCFLVRLYLVPALSPCTMMGSTEQERGQVRAKGHQVPSLRKNNMGKKESKRPHARHLHKLLGRGQNRASRGFSQDVTLVNPAISRTSEIST